VNEMITQPCFVLSSDGEEGSLTLADGSMLHVRPAQQADARALQHFYDGLSAGSRYQRFFGFLIVLTEERARAFTQLDSADGLALIALDPADPERIVAVVGYGREAGAERADYAAAVADDWQGRGLGLALTRRLVAAARRRGVRQLTAAMLPQNARMRGVFDALGLAMRGEWEDGFVRIDLYLGPIERVDLPQHASAAAD
jgi:RimJ/RimL family protein N-acetyltransferase